MNYEATAPLGYAALSDIIQEKFGRFNGKDSYEVQSARAELKETVIESARQIVEDLTGLKVSKKEAARVVAEDFHLMTMAGQRKRAVQKENKRAASGAR